MSAQCRAGAARVIAQVQGGAALDEPLRAALAQTEAADRPLLQQLCYGTLRHHHRLDAVLRQLLQKPLQPKDADVRALLLCGMHQLFDMATPDHAAVSATVEACRELQKPWATKLVNAVLRRSARERDELLAGLQAWESASHPRWLFEAIGESWPADADGIIDANNQHPPMCLRVNRRRTDRDAYLEKLRAEDIHADPCALAPDGIRLQRAVDVSRLPGFAEGLVSVQDEAAQLAAELLRLPPGARVLDACAAPGGKACHLLERNADIGAFYAMDIDGQRLSRVEENVARLGLQCELLTGDGRAPPPQLAAGTLDAILLDAPCSATGVIRRHPDIKLLRRERDTAAFAQTQLELLRGLWPLLRPGGELLYVTCSILPAENGEVIRRFLTERKAEQDAAQLRPLRAEWGREIDGCRQLLPEPDGPDGMFFASLVRAG